MGDRDLSTRETFAAKEGQEKPTASQSSPLAAGSISGELDILDHSQFPAIPPSRYFRPPAVPSPPPPSRNWPRSFSSLLRSPLRPSNPRPVPISPSTKVAVSPPTASTLAEKAVVEPTTSTKGQSPATALVGIDKVTDDSNPSAKESSPVASTTEAPPAASKALRNAERGIDLNMFLSLPLNLTLQNRPRTSVESPATASSSIDSFREGSSSGSKMESPPTAATSSSNAAGGNEPDLFLDLPFDVLARVTKKLARERPGYLSNPTPISREEIRSIINSMNQETDEESTESRFRWD